MPCYLVDKYQRFEGTCCIRLFGVRGKFFRNVGIAFCFALRYVSEIPDLIHKYDSGECSLQYVFLRNIR